MRNTLFGIGREPFHFSERVRSNRAALRIRSPLSPLRNPEVFIDLYYNAMCVLKPPGRMHADALLRTTLESLVLVCSTFTYAMDTEVDEHAKISLAESILNYEFRSKDWLLTALVAAGAAEDNHDGNRKLGQVGISFIELVSIRKGFEDDNTRGKCHPRM